MCVGTSGIVEFGGGGKALRQHFTPGLQQSNIPIRHAGMLECSRQIKLIKEASFHQLGRIIFRMKSGVQNSLQDRFLVCCGNHVQQHGSDVCVLAVRVLSGIVHQKAKSWIPAQLVNSISRCSGLAPVALRQDGIP